MGGRRNEVKDRQICVTRPWSTEDMMGQTEHLMDGDRILYHNRQHRLTLTHLRARREAVTRVCSMASRSDLRPLI
jgi:predicted phosphohydrolase